MHPSLVPPSLAALFAQESVAYQQGATGFVMLGLAGMAFALCVVFLGHQSRDRRRRLDLMEQALRNPSLAPDVQRELVKALQPMGLPRLLHAAGWFATVGGVGWLCTDPHGQDFRTAVILTIAGFAVITLPLVLRELEGKKA